MTDRDYRSRLASANAYLIRLGLSRSEIEDYWENFGSTQSYIAEYRELVERIQNELNEEVSVNGLRNAHLGYRNLGLDDMWLEEMIESRLNPSETQTTQRPLKPEMDDVMDYIKSVPQLPDREGFVFVKEIQDHFQGLGYSGQGIRNVLIRMVQLGYIKEGSPGSFTNLNLVPLDRPSRVPGIRNADFLGYPDPNYIYGSSTIEFNPSGLGRKERIKQRNFLQEKRAIQAVGNEEDYLKLLRSKLRNSYENPQVWQSSSVNISEIIENPTSGPGNISNWLNAMDEFTQNNPQYRNEFDREIERYSAFLREFDEGVIQSQGNTIYALSKGIMGAKQIQSLPEWIEAREEFFSGVDLNWIKPEKLMYDYYEFLKENPNPEQVIMDVEQFLQGIASSQLRKRNTDQQGNLLQLQDHNQDYTGVEVSIFPDDWDYELANSVHVLDGSFGQVNTRTIQYGIEGLKSSEIEELIKKIGGMFRNQDIRIMIGYASNYSDSLVIETKKQNGVDCAKQGLDNLGKIEKEIARYMKYGLGIVGSSGPKPELTSYRYIEVEVEWNEEEELE